MKILLEVKLKKKKKVLKNSKKILNKITTEKALTKFWKNVDIFWKTP